MKRLKKIMSGLVLFVLLVLAACSSKAKQNNYLASWTDNTFAKNYQKAKELLYLIWMELYSVRRILFTMSI